MSQRNEKVIEEYIFNRENKHSLANSITPEQGIQLGLRLSTRNQPISIDPETGEKTERQLTP